VWALLALAYYYIPEALSGQTPGKRLLSLRVTGTDGRKPSPAAIVARTVLRIVDFLPAFYLFGLVVILCSGQRRQRIGDLAADRRVEAQHRDLDSGAAKVNARKPTCSDDTPC
jgi:uncharacterized RDD family membrane protein YckC